MGAPSWYRAESERFLHLDAMRFFSAAAITLFHYVGMVWPGPNPGPLSFFTPLHLGVDLFFVISGIMMADLYRGRVASTSAYLGFMRKRVARIAPLHYLTFFFFLIASTVMLRAGLHIDHIRNYDPRCIIPNLTMTHAFGVCEQNTFNTPSWSVSCEMALYVALPILLWVTRRQLIGFVAVGLTLFALSAWDSAWPSRTYDLGVLRALPSFGLGLLLADARPLLARIPAPRVLLGVATVALVLLVVLPVGDLARLPAIYVTVALALAADRRGAAGPIVHAIAPLGRLTYSIYMLNEPVMLVLGQVPGRMLHLTGTGYAVWMGAVALTALPVCSLASLVLFETPMRRWLSGRAMSSTGSAHAPAMPPSAVATESKASAF